VTVRGLAKHAVELFMSYSVRPITFAALLAMFTSVFALAGAVTAAFHVPSAVALLGLALSGGLLSLAVVARYLVHIGRGQQGPPLFLIQEANIPVREEDRLYPAAVMERVS